MLPASHQWACKWPAEPAACQWGNVSQEGAARECSAAGAAAADVMQWQVTGEGVARERNAAGAAAADVMQWQVTGEGKGGDCEGAQSSRGSSSTCNIAVAGDWGGGCEGAQCSRGSSRRCNAVAGDWGGQGRGLRGSAVQQGQQQQM